MFENKEKTVPKDLKFARRNLLKTGPWNRWVHVNHAHCLNLIHDQADDVFAILRVQGRACR